MLKIDAAIVTIILIGTAFLATYPHVNIPSKNKLHSVLEGYIHCP